MFELKFTAIMSMKYLLTYSFDISGLYVTEQDFETVTKKMSYLVAALGDYMIEDNLQFGRNIPPFDPNCNSCIIKFNVVFNDFSLLQEGIKFFNSFCIMHYIKEDESPIINSL